MRICVWTERDSAGKEVPCGFQLGEKRLRVVTILRRWSEHSERFFEVRVEDERRFILRFDADPCRWDLTAVFGARPK
jgi:hypothetical protein